MLAKILAVAVLAIGLSAIVGGVGTTATILFKAGAKLFKKENSEEESFLFLIFGAIFMTVVGWLFMSSAWRILTK